MLETKNKRYLRRRNDDRLIECAPLAFGLSALSLTTVISLFAIFFKCGKKFT